MREIIGNTTTTPVAPTDLSKVANALRGTASGAVVVLKDVSPLEHEINVKLITEETETYICNMNNSGVEWYFANGAGDYIISSVSEGDLEYARVLFDDDESYCETWWRGSLDYTPSVGDIIRYNKYDDIFLVEGSLSSVTLKNCGANLIDQSRGANPTTNNKFGITLTYIPEEDCLCLNGTNAGGNTNVGCSQPIDYVSNGVVGQSYVASVKHISGTATIPSGSKWDVCFFFGQKTSPTVNENSNWMNVHLDNTDNEATAVCTKPYIGAFWAFVIGGVTFDNYKFKIQLQLGKKATEYEPYKSPETVSVNADGTATVIGKGEEITLTTDTDGVTIEAEYNKDTNKVIESLVNAIISLGGNV